MLSFKQAMAFPLLATVIWLAWVYARLTSLDDFVALLFGLLIISFSIWFYNQFVSHKTPIAQKAITLLTCIGIFGYGIYLGTRGIQYDKTEEIAQWEPYSKDYFQSLRAQGKPVFIDFTAAWCLSCQANKASTLNTKDVVKAFKGKQVTLLKADWTNQDPVITEALESFNRNGVPLNVYYPAQINAEPIVLPAILQPSVVLNVLNHDE